MEYRTWLDYEMDMMGEGKPVSDLFERLEAILPLLQLPQNRHRLERIMELLNTARQRREAIGERLAS